MLVKLGQVSMIVDAGVVIRPLDAQMTVVDQLNQPGFRLNVVKDLGLPAPNTVSDESTVIFDSFRAAPGRGADLLALQVNAYSPDEARKALTTAMTQIDREHQRLFGEAVRRMKSELADTSTRLEAARQEYASAFNALKATRGRDTNAANDLFTTNVVTTISRQIIDLQRRKSQLEDSLDPIRTYPTQTVDAPYTPAKPSSPGRAVYIGLGALAGILAGAALFMLMQFRRNQL